MYRPLLAFTVALATAALPLSTASAQNLVRNGSFESYTGVWDIEGFGAVLPNQTTLTDWRVASNLAIAVFRTPNDYELTGAHGSQWLDLTGPNLFGSGVMAISQVITGLSVGQQYRFTMSLGVNNGSCGIALNRCGGPIGARASIGTQSADFVHGPTAPGNQWADYGFTFTATNHVEELTILGTSGPAAGIYLGVDNVRLVADAPTVVPEPSTYALLATGLASLAAVGRRRRRV